MILSPHLLFPQSFTEDVRCKSPILAGNPARIILPTNPLRTRRRARGQVVRLLLIKPFDQSPFSSARVVLWAPPVSSSGAENTSLCAEMQPARRSPSHGRRYSLCTSSPRYCALPLTLFLLLKYRKKCNSWSLKLIWKTE